MTFLQRLLRPLWHEDPGYRKRRVLRQMLMVPVMMLGGAAWGLLASPTDAGVLAWVVGGAVAFGTGAWLYLHLQPALLAWAETHLGRVGRFVGTALDWAIVGGTVWLVTDVLGVPTFPAVTSAIGLGGLYAALVAGFWDDAGSRLLHGLLRGMGGGGWSRVAPPFSHIQSLLSRGENEAARTALEAFVDDHPSDARGWLALARLTAVEDDGLEDAVGLLRSGMERGDLPLETRRLYVGELLSIRERQGSPHLAGRELARLAEEAGGTVVAMWAQQELARLRKSSGAE